VLATARAELGDSPEPALDVRHGFGHQKTLPSRRWTSWGRWRPDNEHKLNSPPYLDIPPLTRQMTWTMHIRRGKFDV
jgi:hypothetical protein